MPTQNNDLLNAAITEPLECTECRRPKAMRLCECCLGPVCKSCEEFLAPDTFSFLTELPETLTHSRYCPSCYAAEVEPALSDYSAKIQEAKQAFFFYKTQKRALPVIRKSSNGVKVDACADRNETILRLGFLAVQQGCNSIIEAEVKYEKVRNGAYQTTRWSGHGLPAQVDRERLERLGLRSDD